MCSTGSSGSCPLARNQTFWKGGSSSVRSTGADSQYRVSIGRGRSYQAPSRSLNGAMRVRKSGHVVGVGQAVGHRELVVEALLGRWKLAERWKIVLPCWIARTRRVTNERPSRMRSTS